MGYNSASKYYDTLLRSSGRELNENINSVRMKEVLWQDGEPQGRVSGELTSMTWVMSSTKRGEFVINQMTDSLPRNLWFLELDSNFGHENEQLRRMWQEMEGYDLGINFSSGYVREHDIC